MATTLTSCHTCGVLEVKVFHIFCFEQNIPLKGISNKRTFKIISKRLLQIFHILLDSFNIFTENNELPAILDY